MKKIMKIKNLDCANCAADVEKQVAKLDGVISCKVNFLTQKFTLEAEDEVFSSVFEKAYKIAKSVEKDVEIL